MTENSVRVYNATDEARGMSDMNTGQNVMDNMRSMLGRVDVRGFVDAHPVEASLAALGLGVVAALLFMSGPSDRYDKLQHRLEKSMKDVVKVKKQADEEIAELRDAAKHAEKKQQQAETRAKKAEERLEAVEQEGGAEEQSRSWRALVFSALGAQLVHLITRWVSDRFMGERETDETRGNGMGGRNQPVTSEYSEIPPI